MSDFNYEVSAYTGYIITLHKCPSCRGQWKYYDEHPGYQAWKCEKCGLNIRDVKVEVG